MAGVTPQDYEVYARYMQSQGQSQGQPQPPVQGMASGGLVSQINPFYSYVTGLKNATSLDSNPAIVNGQLPALPNYSAPLSPVGLETLIPQQPGQLPDLKPSGQQGYATGGVVSLSPLQQRMAQAMRYYTGMGYSPAQAAGIVGNLTAESNLNPGINEKAPVVAGSRGGYGLAQWTGPRRRALEEYAANQGKPVSDTGTQLDFFMKELSGPEKAAGNALAKAQNVEQATQAMIGYERPQGWSANNPTAGHNYSGRLNYARQAYQLATGENPAMASVPDISTANQTAQTGLSDPSMATNIASGMADTSAAMANTANAAETADPFGGLISLLAMSQQQAPAPAPAAPVRKAQPVDPDYATAVTSQTPDAYADYLQRRRQMMGA